MPDDPPLAANARPASTLQVVSHDQQIAGATIHLSRCRTRGDILEAWRTNGVMAKLTRTGQVRALAMALYMVSLGEETTGGYLLVELPPDAEVQQALGVGQGAPGVGRKLIEALGIVRPSATMPGARFFDVLPSPNFAAPQAQPSLFEAGTDPRHGAVSGPDESRIPRHGADGGLGESAPARQRASAPWRDGADGKSAPSRHGADLPDVHLRSAGARLSFSASQLLKPRAEAELARAPSRLDLDEGAREGNSASALSSGTDGDGEGERRKAAVKWLLNVDVHFGQSGDGGDKQRRGDRTCSGQMFDTLIWPADVDPPEGRARLVIALDHCARAKAKKAADKAFNAMSYLWTCLRNMDAKRQAKAARRKPIGADALTLVRGVLRDCERNGWPPTGEKAIDHAARSCQWDRATWLAHLAEFEAAAKYEPAAAGGEA